jgi:AcrR family transcriptional regulator
MSQQGQSMRVRRTQKLLREALIEVIEDVGFDTLTVGRLTERALISRAAFYRQYRDKYDLVEQIFADATASLLTMDAAPGTEHPPRVWIAFFEHIAAYDRLYRALLGRKGSPWFIVKMRAFLCQLITVYERLPIWQLPRDRTLYPASATFVPDLVAGMVVEVITWWLAQETRSTPEELATRCAALASAIFKETSTWP